MSFNCVAVAMIMRRIRNATSTLSATEQGRQTETERYVCRWMQHLSDDVRLLAQLSMFHLPDEREREKQIRNLCSYNSDNENDKIYIRD